MIFWFSRPASDNLKPAFINANVSLLKLERPLQTSLLETLAATDQTILDALPLGVYACDLDGRILRYNQRAIELWGRSPGLSDPVQRFCACFRVESLEGDFIPPEQTPMAQAVLSGKSFEGAEAVVQNPDGKRWVARVNVAPLRDANGEVIGAINCFQDVTREHEMRSCASDTLSILPWSLPKWALGATPWLTTSVSMSAQRLYGLAEGRFIHDEQGVKSKFHPDDMDRMWSRVTQALDPEGDGRYEVEYRVKQPDASWRWLSAWGLVEFEGQGATRKPIAIAGASRDISEAKRTEDLERLLGNEINHRVRNTLATVQSIVLQSLRGAVDLKSARRAVDARITALAGAHELLTDRSWLGADIKDVVARAVAPFASGCITVNGPSLDVSPKQALALSLALHELATNAVKHGALSQHGGRVELLWNTQREQLNLSWRETGARTSSRRLAGDSAAACLRMVYHATLKAKLN